MQPSFPPALRIAQSVETLATADTSSLVGLNTNELSPDCCVFVQENNKLYVLHKTDNSSPAASPNLIVPLAGPGRWYQYGEGATYFQSVNLAHAAIPPQSSVDTAATVNGVSSGSDIVVFNLTDTGLPAGVSIGPVRITGANAAVFRFLNATAATVAAATVTVEAAVLNNN